LTPPVLPVTRIVRKDDFDINTKPIEHDKVCHAICL